MNDDTAESVMYALDLARTNLHLDRNGPTIGDRADPAEAVAASLALAHMHLERAGHDTGYEWRSTGGPPPGPRCPECGSSGPPLASSESDGLVCGGCWEPSPVSEWYAGPDAVEAVHEGKREAVLRAIADQAAELRGEDEAGVTCPCGASGPLRLMYRCLYCEVFFCPRCAADHFGEDGRER